MTANITGLYDQAANVNSGHPVNALYATAAGSPAFQPMTRQGFNPWTGLPDSITSTPAQIAAGKAGQKVVYTPAQIAAEKSFYPHTSEGLSEAPIQWQASSAGPQRGGAGPGGGGGGMAVDTTGDTGYGYSSSANNAINNLALGFGNTANTQAYDAVENKGGWNGFMNKFVPLATIALAAAGTGGAAASAVGGTGGAITGGAVGGAISAAGNAAVNDRPLTLGTVGKGAALGAVGGAVGQYVKPIVGQTTGLTGDTGNIVNSGITKGITGGVTGAVGGALSGKGAGAGAVSGAEGGALSGAGGAVGGSIFNSPGSTIAPGITQASNPNVADFDSTNYDPGQYDPFSGVSAGDQFNNYTPTDLGAGSDNYGTGSSPNYLDPSQLGGGGGSAAGAQAGSSLGGLLSKLFGGAGGTGGLPAGLLQQLLGAGLTSGGNYLDKKAAVDAANNYANKSKFNPYTINGANGSTSFNGTTANSTLSPQQQQIQKMLQGLSNSSGASLAAGPQGAINSNFNALQSADLQAQQRLLGNTQDDEFSHGVLGSTAGGYQTQGALQAIGAQTGQNYNTAVQNANTQQQQQLAQLTGSLNGNNAINAQQMAQMGLGLDAGSAASKANSVAYAPGVAPNSQSLWGNLLQGFGNNLSSKGP